jgi:hypothetical protein
MTMTPEGKKLIADHVKAIAKILYNTPADKIETFEGIETIEVGYSTHHRQVQKVDNPYISLKPLQMTNDKK